MKLATLNNGSRDGRLVVVSHDLTRFTDVTHIAANMRDAIDNWGEFPQFEQGNDLNAYNIIRKLKEDSRSANYPELLKLEEPQK